jgi:hypothetical protein
MSAALESINVVSLRASRLKPRDVNETALVSFLVGACYALSRAAQLNYVDETGRMRALEYAARVRGVAAQIANGTPLLSDPNWLASFYFNAALQRMAALNERIGSHFDGGKSDRAPAVRRDVNALKHNRRSASEIGRLTSIEAATSTLEALANWLEEHVQRQESTPRRSLLILE